MSAISYFGPHFQHVYEVCVSLLGEEEFNSRYPEIGRLSREASHGASPMPLTVFEAMVSKIAGGPDELDIHLLNAARLDLHGRQVGLEYMHRGDDGPNDLQLRSIVADRFGKGFVIANYLAHISNNRRYLYVSVPKVGCTKIKRILQEAEYGHLLPNIHQVHEPIFSPLLEPIDDIKLLNAVLAEPDWTRFTFVRNPFTRVLSCYMDKIVRSPWERQRLLPTLGLDPDALPSFAEFLECVSGQDDLSRDIHWASQHHLARPDLVDYTFVGRFERFTEDLRKICDTLGITPLEPLDKAEHHLGATGKLAEFYGERERRLVAGIYECDFEVFGYDPSDLPRQ